MQRDASLIGEINQGCSIIADCMLDRASHFLDRDGIDPVRVVARHRLLEKAFLIDSIRITLQ